MRPVLCFAPAVPAAVRQQSLQGPHMTTCTFRHFSYKQRLEELNLISLELRRLHLDLIMCYKITFGLVKLCFEDFFQFSPKSTTRGHPYKLFVQRCTTNVGKHFFSCRVVEPWNNLPCNIADFSSLNNFKRSLYLCNQDAYLLVHHD